VPQGFFEAKKNKSMEACMNIKITKFKSLNSFIKFLDKKYGKLIDFDVCFHERAMMDKEFLHVSKLEVYKEKRRRGVGTQFMLDICRYADYSKLWVRLTPVPMGEEMDQKRLDNFYRKFGFRFMAESKTMHRRPRTEFDENLNTRCTIKRTPTE